MSHKDIAMMKPDLLPVSAGFTRRGALQVGGLAGFAMLMTACAANGPAPTPGAGGGAAKAGGSVVWAINSDPVSLAPFGMTNSSGVLPKNLIYESLINWDDTMGVHPALAESWEVPDEKTYIFHLRKGVKFHGGEDFTAEDVKYSFDSQQTPPPPGSVNLEYPKVAEIEVIDDYTVKFTMSQPDGTVLGYCAALRYSFITPKNMYDKLDPSNQANGTGPFKLEKFVPNDHVALVKNENYWDKGLPYLDAVTLKVLIEMQAVVSGITSGAVDGGFIDADTAKIFAGNKNVNILKKPAVAFRELEWTLKDPSKPWFDARVRQAINYAIDREKIITNVYAGEADYSSKIPPSYGDWAIPNAELKSNYEKFDVAKAKALMKEAGYEDGFAITAQTIAAVEYPALAQVIAEQLKVINIDVTVQPLEIGIFAKNNSDGSFDWQITGRGMRGDPSGYFSDFDPVTSTYKAWFEGGWSNDEMTSLISQGLGEPDADKRHEIYLKMQEIALTEWPTVPLVAPMQFQAARARVQDMPVDIGSSMRYLRSAWVSE